MSGVRHYQRKGEEGGEEFDLKEYFIKEEFKTTSDSLALFKDDSLLCRPGSECHYTTHGFTLLARVIEAVTEQPFDKYLEAQLRELGLANTYLDKPGPLIANRARYYVRNEYHRLRNAPYVDPSYKWAGGGLLSTVGDLIRFGSAMLYSYQQKSVHKATPSAQKPSPNPGTEKTEKTLPPPAPESEKSEKVVEKPDSLPVPGEDPEDPRPLTSPQPVDTAGAPEPGQVTSRDVDYKPGPMSSVNRAPPTVRYLPGFLRADTMAVS